MSTEAVYNDTSQRNTFPKSKNNGTTQLPCAHFNPDQEYHTDPKDTDSILNLSYYDNRNGIEAWVAASHWTNDGNVTIFW